MTASPVDASKLAYRACVGVMVINRAGLVWVGRRADMPGDAEGSGSWWQMPQGGINEGESPDAAALRELQEETGITSARIIAATPKWLRYDLPPHLVGVAWDGKYRGQEQKWYAMRFLGDDSEINITPADRNTIEFDAWKWVEIGQLAALIVPFKREVYRQVIDAFAAHATPLAQ